MRKIREHENVKFSEFAFSEFSFKGKIIEFYKVLTTETITKIQSQEIEITLENWKKSFLKILWEQIHKRDNITYEELEELESTQLYIIQDVFINNSGKIKEYYQKSEIKNPFCRFLTVIKENIKEIQEEGIEIKNSVDSSINKIGDVIREFKRNLDDISIKVLKKVYELQGISEDKMDFSPEKKKIAMDLIHSNMFSGLNCKRSLEKYNWFINADFNKVEQKKILAIEDNEEKINEYILSISTNESILKLLDIWKGADILNRRMHIIERCINSYMEEEYWLFIPTMLAQLEGVIIDIFDVRGKYVIEDLKEKIDNLVKLTGEEFNSKAKSFYLDIILSGFEVGKECEVLSRHSILHGYNTQYGTKLNALKVIYFFDHVIRALYYASDSVLD